jgi:hypothetical protein
VLAIYDQSRRGQGLVLVIGENQLERRTIGCVADAVACGNLSSQAAPLEVVDRTWTLLELLPIEMGGLFQRFPKGGRRLRAVLFLGGFRYGQTGILGQCRHRIAKAHVLVLHQEADGGAVCATPKAMIELLGRTDSEGGGLLAVKRTTGLVVLPGLFQRHTPVDDVDDVDSGEQSVDEIARDHGCCMINPGRRRVELSPRGGL